MTRTITIDPVTRIEGHARVLIDLADSGGVEFAGMVVNELRGFERILVGMEADRMPQITGRICGVCPSAHALAAVRALDAAAGVEVPVAGHLLRELLYMGHFIHSHAVHIFALAGPDLVFGIDGAPAQQNIVGIVDAVPEVAKKALRLRSLGQKINEAIGGRGVHPVTVFAGGMSFQLDEERRQAVEKMAVESVALVKELGSVVKELLLKVLDKNPVLKEIAIPSAYLGTVKNGKVNFYDGDLRLVDETGAEKLLFPSADYDKHLSEHAIDWSYMKPVYANYDGDAHLYRVGPLGRLNAADGMETPLAQEELTAFRETYGHPCNVTALQHYARLIELIYACEKAVELASNPAITGESRVPVKFPGGRGVGHVEAPRGTLTHEYEIDEKGIVRAANLVVATQHNYAAINRSIEQSADAFVVGKGDDALLNGIEFAIRCYDPCLSCATHAVGRMPLEVSIRQGGKTLRTLRRNL